MKRSLLSVYNEFFEVKIAQSKEDLEKVYKLRYEVYVHERGWEQENSEGIEKDEYDDNALHCLLVFKPKNLVIGTARVVLPNPDNLLESYPLQTITQHPMLHEKQYVSRMAEISRMAISSHFRKEIISDKKLLLAIAQTGANPKSAITELGSCMSAGLMAGIFDMLNKAGLQGAFAVMEPVFLRMLRKNGIRCKLLGNMIEHRGKRQPCYLDLETISRIKYINEDIYNFISKEGELVETMHKTYKADKQTPLKQISAA